jgi:hypothetical protein
MATYTYNFQTSQPLTQYQIDYINQLILENLPSQNEDLEDIPEWTTELELSEIKEEDF